MGLMLIFLTIGLHSIRQAALVLGVVPLAMLGGLISLHVTGQNLNVASGVGFIALFGVAVQNGIIMISNLNRMRKAGYDLHEAIMKGATERLRPVLMTATVATLGMLPAAIHTGVGSDVQRGIATVVVGGLAISTLLTCSSCPRCIMSSSVGPRSAAGQRRGGRVNERASGCLRLAGGRSRGLRRRTGFRTSGRPERHGLYGAAAGPDDSLGGRDRR
jgi:cobalt-zinc-cadmium resistance protein CzcA